MKTEIVKESLKKAISYPDYVLLMEKLVEEEKTTGADQNGYLIELTRLNRQRMKRLDKTLKISETISEKIQKNAKKQTWLVITEAWCGDASQIIPAVYKAAQENENISVKLVLRDENEALMNLFLTNGGKAIPMVISVDEPTGEVNFVWGPRPKKAMDLVKECKEKNGVFTAECKEDLQRWYNADKGQSVMEELSELVEN